MATDMICDECEKLILADIPNKLVNNLNLCCNTDQLNIDSSELANYSEMFGESKYVDTDSRSIFNTKKINELGIIHFNIRSLQKHIDEINIFLAGLEKKPEIVAFSETKLKEGKANRNVELEGYNFIHRDSITAAGGVGLYILKSLSYSVNNSLSNFALPNAEHLWIDIQTSKTSIVIGVIYRYPVNTVTAIDEFSDKLNELLLSLKKPYYCVGDLNVNLLNICRNNEIRRYANMLLSCNCKCLINVATRITENSKSLLDHLYTNDKKSAITAEVLILDLSDHYGIYAIISDSKVRSQKHNENYCIRDMSNFVLDNFLDKLLEKLTHLLNTSYVTVNELYDSFVAIFAEVVDKFAPMRKASRKEKKLKRKPWISNDLLKSIKIKNKMFKFLHKNRDDLALKERYKTYRNTLNRVIRQSKRNYSHKILDENKGNSKTTWDVINELVNHISRNKSLPLKLKTSAGDTVAEDPQIIADEFNNFFVSIGKEMASSIQTCRSHVSSKIFSEEPLRASNAIFLAPSTEMEVYGLINQIKSHKARRTNDIESRFIKLANPVIANFLSEMFNLSLTTGIYPDAMKVAEVIPIFKKGDRDKSTNYRPISLLSQFNKIFEKMLHSRIYSFVTKYNLLSEKQFGFRTNFSTNLAACSVYDEIVNEIDQNLYNCGIFLDLSKAFDTVNHNILVNKLENYFGFRGRALELMKSYLTNRFQYTKIGNSKSKLLPIECGVPQGLSPGPLLFILYINDLPLASKFSATLYADDTYLALSDKNLTQLETRVNDQ